MVWGQGIWGGAEFPPFGKGANPWHEIWCPRSQLFVKVGARVGSTVSDILMVNPDGVIDVFSLYTFN